MSETRFELRLEADGEVTRPEHADQCLAVHPNEPCPGYPHDAQEG